MKASELIRDILCTIARAERAKGPAERIRERRETASYLNAALDTLLDAPPDPPRPFQPTADDLLAADLASRFGIVVWTQPTSHGLLWALQPPTLQRH